MSEASKEAGGGAVDAESFSSVDIVDLVNLGDGSDSDDDDVSTASADQHDEGGRHHRHHHGMRAVRERVHTKRKERKEKRKERRAAHKHVHGNPVTTPAERTSTASTSVPQPAAAGQGDNEDQSIDSSSAGGSVRRHPRKARRSWTLVTAGKELRAAYPRAVAVAESVLRQLGSPREAPTALELLRTSDTLRWMDAQCVTGRRGQRSTVLGAFVRTCASRGYTEALECAIAAVPGCVDAPDDHGRTALHWAAHCCHLVTLNRLMDLGADSAREKDGGETLLHVLAKRRIALKGIARGTWLTRATHYVAAGAAASSSSSGAGAAAAGAERDGDASDSTAASAPGGKGLLPKLFFSRSRAASVAGSTHTRSSDDDDNNDAAAAAAAAAATQLPPPPVFSEGAGAAESEPGQAPAAAGGAVGKEAAGAESEHGSRTGHKRFTTAMEALVAVFTPDKTNTVDDGADGDEAAADAELSDWSNESIESESGTGDEASSLGSDVLSSNTSHADYSDSSEDGDDADGDGNDTKPGKDDGDDDDEDDEDDGGEAEEESTDKGKSKPGSLTTTTTSVAKVLQARLSAVMAAFERPTQEGGASSGSGEGDSAKRVDWSQFTDEGALSKVVPEFGELVCATTRRLCRILDPRAPNAAGQTPVALAKRHRNVLVARTLCECIAELDRAAEPPQPSVPASILSFLHHSSSSSSDLAVQATQGTTPATATATTGGATTAAAPEAQQTEGRVKKYRTRREYIAQLRTIMDMQPHRVPLAPLAPYKRGDKVRILSMDGGGIRCIMHPMVLGQILQRFPDFIDRTYMFCGCSGSSPICSMLQLGYNCVQLRALLEQSAVQTLTKKEGNQITGFKYSSKWMRLSYDLIFGDMRLVDMPRAQVVPAFHLDNGFVPDPQQQPGQQQQGQQQQGERRADSTMMNNIGPGCGTERLADMCMRSGSAPTYFRCYQGFVDGGVFCNNAAGSGVPLCAGVPPQGCGVDLQDIVCLALGTGYSCQPYFADEKLVVSGGVLDYGIGILDLYDLGQRFFIDNVLRAQLGDRYFRFNPPTSGIKLDNVDQIPDLKALFATIDLTPLMDWIATHWY